MYVACKTSRVTDLITVTKSWASLFEEVHFFVCRCLLAGCSSSEERRCSRIFMPDLCVFTTGVCKGSAEVKIPIDNVCPAVWQQEFNLSFWCISAFTAYLLSWLSSSKSSLWNVRYLPKSSAAESFSGRILSPSGLSFSEAPTRSWLHCTRERSWEQNTQLQQQRGPTHPPL